VGQLSGCAVVMQITRGSETALFVLAEGSDPRDKHHYAWSEHRYIALPRMMVITMIVNRKRD